MAGRDRFSQPAGRGGNGIRLCYPDDIERLGVREILDEAAESAGAQKSRLA
jgi:hypothetical protein